MNVGNYTLTKSINGTVAQLGEYGVTFLGDLNGDFKVNSQDITAFVLSYINYYNTGNANALTDYNFDDKINSQDITQFVLEYLEYRNSIA